MALKGRPSKFTDATATRICARLAAGETLRAICRDDGMPAHSTVLDWVKAKETFSDQYARAREKGYALLADEILEIADDGRNDTYVIDEETGQRGTDHDVIARSRLRVDTRKWLLSKCLPKIYGDKLQVDANVTHDISNLTDDELARALLEAGTAPGSAETAGPP